MKLKRVKSQLNPQGYWFNPVANHQYLRKDAVRTFDQNGYALCPLELHHAITNNYEACLGQHQVGEWSIRLPWYMQTDKQYGAHLNHAILVERKAYIGVALEELLEKSRYNVLLWKLIRMKPKWGIDISIDYADNDGNVFEVFHHEWDALSYNAVRDMQGVIEEFVDKADFADIAEKLWAKRDKWEHLTYDEMSNYKCDFVGMPRERYKMANWHE